MRTPSQTVGPFFSIGLSRRPQNELPGGELRLSGSVVDGDGNPVEDAIVEIWDPAVGFGRCGCGAGGEYSFLVPPTTRRLQMLVFARGLLKPVLTRVYAPGEEGAEDPTLVALEDARGLRFDVHLQGEQETAFFEL